MLAQLLHALIHTDNEAADDLLLEALSLGNEREKTVALDAIIRRGTLRGLGGVIGQYNHLPPAVQERVLANIRSFYHALRECGRSDETLRRLTAMKLIALGRQGKLSYVLSENLHDADETLSHGAVEAMVALARWVADESRRLQEQGLKQGNVYTEVIEQRAEIEQALARAMDSHRGKHGQDLLSGALLLCDWPQSRTLAILHTGKHAGQSPMVRRLQQPPSAENVPAFLLGASHGGLRSHFGSVFAHINEAPVLDAILRKTHWLKDHQLRLCMHQITRGTWWDEAALLHDIERRTPAEASLIGEWVAASGSVSDVQDRPLAKLLDHAREDFAARLGILRIAARRPRGESVEVFKRLLNDPDERLVRLAAREILRRRPADYESMLLQLMTGAAESVRRVVGRSLGRSGFESFWRRFDRLNRGTRRQAGKAMLKLLPDAPQHLSRRLTAGPIEQRLKAMQMTHELGLVEPLREVLLTLCDDPHPKLRSKAISALGGLAAPPSELLLDRALNDNDPRVRANAIEALESRANADYLPLLAQRARSTHNRERANAIKALHRMRVGAVSEQLSAMLRDERAEHRISAMWTLRQIGFWRMLNDVAQMAKVDPNLRVRRYALGVLRGVAELAQQRRNAG